MNKALSSIRLALYFWVLVPLNINIVSAQKTIVNHTKEPTERKKMIQIEIWSDVMCPFCYIGKRKLEEALSKFEHAREVEILWKSYLLDPELVSDSSKSIHEHLAHAKGWTTDYAKEMDNYVSGMAKESGLNYNMDAVKVANTTDAHRLIQFAKTKQKTNEAEEALFDAYFVKGKNLADRNTLIQIAVSIGLDAEETKTILDSGRFNTELQQDIQEANRIGVSGVPFFVFNRKFAVSGAQNADVFFDTLTKS